MDVLIERCQKEGALRFTPDSAQALRGTDVVFLCVGVPPLANGDSDFSALESAVRQFAHVRDAPRFIVQRSTAPVGTGAQLERVLSAYGRCCDSSFRVAINPQFLREGTAVEEFFHPDRILLGVHDGYSERLLRELYAPILEQSFRCPAHSPSCPVTEAPMLLVTNVHSAELIKYASNAFLGVKISYANVVADLCEKLEANVQEVTRAMGLDPRIGARFLEAGIGFGGSRLPTDLRAFCHLAERVGVDAGILQSAEAVNRARVSRFFERVRRVLWVIKGKSIGVLGLAHKPGTDDVRGSPAIELIELLTREGARVCAYDPQASSTALASYPHVLCGSDPYEVAKDADALLIVTAWEEFVHLDWPRIQKMMARPFVLDGRNVLSHDYMKSLGFEYHSVGRPD